MSKSELLYAVKTIKTAVRGWARFQGGGWGCPVCAGCIVSGPVGAQRYALVVRYAGCGNETIYIGEANNARHAVVVRDTLSRLIEWAEQRYFG